MSGSWTARSRIFTRVLKNGKTNRGFEKWKNKQIDCFELNQMIHEFHQKKSHELWNMYNDKDEDFIVTRAVRLGVLQPREISAETAEAIHLDRHINGDRG